MKRQNMVRYFFIALFLFILVQLFLIFSPFFDAIFWAAVLAFAFFPLHERICGIKAINRSAAALSSTLLVVLIVIIPAGIVLASVTKEALELYQQISSYLSGGKLNALIDRIQNTVTSEWANDLWARIETFQEQIVSLAAGTLKNIGNFTAVKVASLTKGILLAIFNFILMVFILFFFFRDGSKIYETVYQLVPMEEKNKRIISDKIIETFSAIIRGQFVTSIAQAILTGMSFWLIGLPLPFLFGSLTFVTSLIPITGAATVWAPFVVYLLITKAFFKAVILLLIGIFIISTSDNLLKTLLIGEKTKLPLFLLFLGLIGGLKLYGFTGIFLGPLVLSLFFVLVKIYQEQFMSDSES